MLIFIEGGPEPYANQAFESDVLLNSDHFKTVMDQYRWTPRTIKGTLDPSKVAQVWQHVSVPQEQTPAVSPVPTAAEDPHATASDDTTQEAVHPLDPDAAESATSGSPDGETATSAPPETSYTGPAVLVEPSDAGDLPDGEQLFLRRKRLKLTVQEVADAVGLARSRVDAIEKGTAKRGNVAADVHAVDQYLTGREIPDADPR